MCTSANGGATKRYGRNVHLCQRIHPFSYLRLLYVIFQSLNFRKTTRTIITTYLIMYIYIYIYMYIYVLIYIYIYIYVYVHVYVYVYIHIYKSLDFSKTTRSRLRPPGTNLLI